MIKKIEISPIEIFKGDHDEYYQNVHEFSIDEKSNLRINFSDYYFNSLTNTNIKDAETINLWKEKSKISLFSNSIPCYKGKFNIPLTYTIIENEMGKYLIILGSEETQPMVYRICIEEICKL